MSASLFLGIVVGLLLLDFARTLAVEWMNLRCLRPDVPPEFQGVYDAEAYAKSQRYLRESTRHGLLVEVVLLPLTLAFILLGGFHAVDEWARGFGWPMIPTGLLFTGALALLSYLVHLPFEIHDTFVIEARYGFNRTRPRTFVADQVKSLLLAALLGGLILSGLLWFFAHAGRWAWLYAWAALVAFQVVLLILAPVLILPLFNRFTPLAPSPLREAIEAYARGQGIALSGIFTMDGSRRSSKGNAFFTGFGRWRRIALYDTLIEKHPPAGIVAVLAHEVGHAKLGHIRKQLLVSVVAGGLTLFLLSLILREPALYGAFGVRFEPVGGQPPFYAGLVFFGFLYAPVSFVIGLAGLALSRRYEFEADAFAARTTGVPALLVDALKKLSVDNLSNLTPHPLKVMLEYSHPPVLERIAALRKMESVAPGSA